MHIQAKVSERFLSKASRLFVGDLRGRIIELLQNARRAGASLVTITNTSVADGWVVTVADDGVGIEDFNKLLNLGDSGWVKSFEASEDPAGVGFYSLAPRKTIVASGTQTVTIDEDGWLGRKPLPVVDAPFVPGTIIEFPDVAWNYATVNIIAKHSGLKVMVDNQMCDSSLFIPTLIHAQHYPELGCKIAIKPASGHDYGIHLNFHGASPRQIYKSLPSGAISALVDMTGEPTPLRLLLPARTEVIENDGYAQLLKAVRVECYRYWARQPYHTLSWREYQEALSLGVPLREAAPVFYAGCWSHDLVDRPSLDELDDRCYRVDDDNPTLQVFADNRDDFMPVEIPDDYAEYSWAKLPTVDNVTLLVGDVLKPAGKQRRYIGSRSVACVSSLTLRVRCSDGKVFEEPIIVALSENCTETTLQGNTRELYVVLAPHHDFWQSREFWALCDAYNEDDGNWESAEEAFYDDVSAYFAQFIGEHEYSRQQLVDFANKHFPRFQQVVVQEDGTVTVRINGEDIVCRKPE